MSRCARSTTPTAPASADEVAGFFDEPVGGKDFALEVAGVDGGVPDGFVDAAQVGQGEGGVAERGGDGGVLEFGAGAFDAVAQDLGVVEGEVAVERLVDETLHIKGPEPPPSAEEHATEE